MNNKILIVAAEKTYINALELVLNSVGYETVSTTNGDDTKNLAETENPALIIIDNKMPQIPGEIISVLLKNSEKTKNIPILLLIPKAKMAGGIQLGSFSSSYLIKPFKSEVLLEKISSIL